MNQSRFPFRRQCLVILALLLVAVFPRITFAQGATTKRKPNVLLILADDLGYETVDCYGGKSYGTPRLNQLAREGVRFENAYAMPLCTNTRVQLMTGLYNNRNWQSFGILPKDAVTFGHLMKLAGYRTCMAGKWQLTSYDPPDYPGAAFRRDTGMRVEDAGFDETSLWHVGHTENKGSRYADPFIVENGEVLSDTQGKYGPDIWTDFLSEFMQREDARPFFAYYSMALPHNPMNPTPDSPEWSDPARRHSDETPFAADMIRYTDKMVGKLLDKLDELKIRENTLVIFYSDNGTNARVISTLASGKTVRGEKGRPTQLGLRVPAIASWPGTLPSGQTSLSLLDCVDILPTILQAAGASEHIPESIDGIGQLDCWSSGDLGPRKWVYIHHDPRPGWDKDRFGLDRLAINHRFKLHEDGRLYDLEKDPFEQRAYFPGEYPDGSAARRELQSVLDSMKPYPVFDPEVVPRDNPSDKFAGHAFQDQGGLVVVEAELLPLPRDESWRVESHTPDYKGLGYLRCLRDAGSDKGQTAIPLSINIAGQWRFAARCRWDQLPSERDVVEHQEASGQVGFRLRTAAEGPWATVAARVGEAISPGQWTWLHFAAPIELAERGNMLWLAPEAHNLKIDRIVVYQDDQAQRALRTTTPASQLHPWSRP